MAFQYSVAVRGARLDAVETQIGVSAVLKIFSGAEPANCAAAEPSGLRVPRSLPSAVRAAAPETIVVADGFSCREQIAQMTDRQALHPVQVMKMAIDDRNVASHGQYPELRYMPDIPVERRKAARDKASDVVGAATAADHIGEGPLNRGPIGGEEATFKEP